MAFLWTAGNQGQTHHPRACKHLTSQAPEVFVRGLSLKCISIDACVACVHSSNVAVRRNVRCIYPMTSTACRSTASKHATNMLHVATVARVYAKCWCRCSLRLGASCSKAMHWAALKVGRAVTLKRLLPTRCQCCFCRKSNLLKY